MWTISFGKLHVLLLKLQGFHAFEQLIGLFQTWKSRVQGFLHFLDTVGTKSNALLFYFNNYVTVIFQVYCYLKDTFIYKCTYSKEKVGEIDKLLKEVIFISQNLKIR